MPEPQDGMHISYRPMKRSDLDQVVALDRASFPSPWPRDAFLMELLKGRQSVCWIAETETETGTRELMGSIVIWLVLDEAHIGTLAIKPDFRRLGIAQDLLSKALRVSYQRGARQAILEVRASNHPAQNLYRKFGFEVVGVRKNYYQDNQEDALLMTLSSLDPDVLTDLGDDDEQLE